MATYVNDLRLKEIATGDSAGTWGTETNVNLELIAEAMGHGTEAIANASTHTITMADGVSDEFRCTFLRLTGGGQACTVTLAPNTLSHTWVMRNETSYTLTLTQGSGASVNISSGQTKIVSTNGGGSGAIVYEMDDLELAGNLVVGGTLGVTGVLTGTSLDISGDIDVDGTTNLDVVDIDGAVDMASTLAVGGVVTASASVVANDEFRGAVVVYSANENSPYLIAGTSGYTGATTNWNTYGVQHRLKTNGGGTPRITIDNNTGEQWSLDASGGMVLSPSAGGTAVFNEDGIDADFRVESDGNANMLFVDGLNNRIGIGTGTPSAMLHLNGTTPYIRFERGGTPTWEIRNNDHATGYGLSVYSVTDSVQLVSFQQDEAVFNENGADIDFRVESDANANMLFVAGSANNVFVGGTSTTTAPSGGLGISASGEKALVVQSTAGDTLVVFKDSGTGSNPPYLGSFGDDMAFGLYGSGGTINVGIGTTAPVDALTLANNTGLAWKMSNSYTHGIFKQTNDLTIRRTSGSGSVAAGDLSLTIAGASGDVTVNTGDLIFGTAGKGIVLGATTNVAANTLDDYEEGTWDPSLKFGGASVSLAYSSRAGKYVKVGRMVYSSFYINLSAKGSSTGDVTIEGIPFNNYTSNQNNAGTVICESGGASWPDSGVYGMTWTDGKIYVRYQAATAKGELSQANFTNSTIFFGMMVYETT